MSDLRDYVAWHQAYDDPNSDLSWRRRLVQSYIRRALARRVGTVRLLSVCSGNGGDVLGVLRDRHDRDRVEVTLIELHPDLAQAARDGARTAGLTRVRVRTADGGKTDAYVGAVPADLVIMVGIFGNISDADQQRMIRIAPQFCRPGATVLWSRARNPDDRNHALRAQFAAAGFSELAYDTRETGSLPAVGAVRYNGDRQQLVAGQPLFTFVR